ncbi:MAG: hypothetical protein KDC53_08135 [Saprospiraceae bacterium]|nr:hypothetical protein [Saprospiraceae bacterium]
MNKQKNIGKIEKILSLKHFHHSFIYPWFLLMLMCFQQGTKHLTINSVQCNIEDSLRPYISYHSNVLAFINVNIMDGSGSPVRRKQTLVINEDIIKMAGDPSEVEIPENCKIIDLAGMTIIPGIIGMHNHLHIPGHPDVGDIATKLYLAAGVTTIQTCGAASPSRELNLSKQIATGTKIGPDIIPSAPFITGVGGNPNMIIPSNDKQLIDTMQYWLNQ